jgi:hypothetical protein
MYLDGARAQGSRPVPATPVERRGASWITWPPA